MDQMQTDTNSSKLKKGAFPCLFFFLYASLQHSFLKQLIKIEFNYD